MTTEKQLIKKQRELIQLLISENTDEGVPKQIFEKLLSEISALEQQLKEIKEPVISAKEFRLAWMKANPNIIHIPSEHELYLMQEYRNL